MVLTHAHHDHIRGGASFEDARVWMPRIAAEKGPEARGRILAAGKALGQRMSAEPPDYPWPIVHETFETETSFVLGGELEVELCPQGTLAERVRAGGAGIGGFFSPTGYGTQAAEGKETREIDGKMYVFETPLLADFTIVRAYRADRWGNCVFRKTARNFSPMMCMAGKVTIVEAEEIVELGALDPDQIHIPGVFVQRVIKGEHYEKWIEQRTVRSATEGGTK